MLLSVVSVLVFAQSSSEFPKGLMNNPVILFIKVETAEICEAFWCIIFGSATCDSAV